MVLDDLKAKVERIEGRTKRFIAAGEAQPEPWTLGLDSLDAALPASGDNSSGSGSAALPYDACHDFTPMVKTDVPQVAGSLPLYCNDSRRNGCSVARLCGARQLSTPANMAGYIHRACWAAFCHQTACYSFVYRKTGTWHWCWKNVCASPVWPQWWGKAQRRTLRHRDASRWPVRKATCPVLF